MKKIAIIGAMLLFLVMGFLLIRQIEPPVPSEPAPVPAPAAPATTPTPSAPAVVQVPQASQAVPAPVPPIPPTPAKAAAPAASLTVTRMVIARSVEDRQPAGIANSFSASQDKVYCYLELTDVTRDQVITYAWTFGQETDRSTQHVKKSAHWRTWSYRAIAGKKGDWKVDVLDESGTVLQSTMFKVE